MAGAIALAMLGGCATPLGEDAPPPVPTLSELPTTSPTPTLPPLPPIPEPEAGTIVIGGQALTIYPKDGSEPQILPYSMPSDEFIDTLSAVFGEEPVLSSYVMQGVCDPSFDQAAWGDGVAVRTNFDWLPPEEKVEIDVIVSSLNGFQIVSSLGLGIGDDDTAYFEWARGQEDAYTSASEDKGQLFTELGYDARDAPFVDDDGNPFTMSVGGVLWATDGIIHYISAPEIFGLAGGC